MFFYPYDDIDTQREKNEILKIKNLDAKLKTHFKELIKIYTIIFIIISFILILYVKELSVFFFILSTFLISTIVSFIIYYLLDFSNIIYNCLEEQLSIERWYGTVNIPKSKIKKIYVKRLAGGKNDLLYIKYISDTNKEKYISINTLFLKRDEMKQFLDIFIV